MEVVNSYCQSCDYKYGCRKMIEGVFVKDQSHLLPTCVCVVHDICRDCKLFLNKKCAAWKMLNGKITEGGILTVCPKKRSV